VDVPAAGGGTLKARRFRPRGQARGLVLSLHGIQSHSEWYVGSSAFLAGRGFYVLAPERRGSGLNKAGRGHVDRYETWLEDLEDARRFAAGEAGFDQVRLVGISWGGKLALAYAAWKPKAIHSTVLVAPGLAPKVGVSPMRKLAIGLSLLVRPQATFEIPLADPRLFTANPVRVRYINEDTLSLHQATARFFYESTKLDRYWRDNLAGITTPALLMLAGQDRIISNERTRAAFGKLGSQDKRVVLYDHAHHTLEFEPDPTVFLHDLATWVQR